MRVLVNQMVLTAASSRAIRVSINGGSSFLATSGDYTECGTNQYFTNRTNIEAPPGSIATVRAAVLDFSQWNTGDVPTAISRTTNNFYRIPGATAEITHLRLYITAGAFSSGSVSVYRA